VLRPRVVRDLTVDAPRGEHGGRFIAAASGLVRTGRHMYVIADDERELGVFPVEGDAPGRVARFLPGELPADPEERKRDKPDVEALALLPGSGGRGAALLALESGSRPNRRAGVVWTLDPGGALAGEPRRIDLAELYRALEDDIDDLNIEGATVRGAELHLFQRGNGRAGINAVVSLDFSRVREDLEGDRIGSDAIAGIRRYELGEVDGVRLCFSDATSLPDGRVVFTAVAETGEDTYRDGGCAGAGVGVLSDAGDVVRWEALDPPAKVEGIDAELDEEAVDAFLVADADDPGAPSPLLRVRLDAPA
jgi:hypothetical protein